MDENLNVLDDTQENVVDSQGQEDVTSEVTEPTTEGTSTVETEEEVANPQQTPEINSQIAAARRRAEQEVEARYLEKMSEYQTLQSQFGRLQSVLGELGYEGSAEQIADTIEAQNRQITPEQVRFEREAQEKAIREAVQNSPEFIHTQEMLKVQTQLANEAMFNSQLAKITQLNPEIKTLADLTKIPDSDVFDGLLATGKYTIDTAYKRLMEIRGAKPKTTDTKSHLQTVGGSANGNYDEVPNDVMEQYKLFMPNATDKQIREHYRKNHGGK